MVDVAVIGAGQTKYGNHPSGLKGMWAEAAERAFASVDQNFEPRCVDEAFIGSVAFGGGQLGNTAALLTEHSGLTFPGTYALMARRHFHEYGSTHDDLVNISVKNHLHGFENEMAHIRKEVSFEKAQSGFMVADPLTLYDCCPTSDGASAVILAADHVVRQFTDDPVWLRSSGAGSDFLALHDRPSITQVRATQQASNAAYKAAGITAADVDLAEVHDCFTIAELMATEDLGFAGRGEGGVFAREERGVRNQGDVCINPSGGLKSKGHPLGATGTGQAVEVFKQLRGSVEDARQVRDAEIGITHNVGGSGATCAVHVFGRDRA